MGEAKCRGSFDERKKTAIKRNKARLIKEFVGVDEETNKRLLAGINPFIEQMDADEWDKRRTQILAVLNTHNTDEHDLETAKPIRVKDDEIAWYLFLCEQAVKDPLCNDVSQVARVAPYFSAIGDRWKYADKVEGIENKIKDTLVRYRKDPDGIIFEILVALSYAEKGWGVKFLDENPPEKSPDMVVKKGGKEFYIECKRHQRTSQYSQEERNQFLKLWDKSHVELIKNNQWIWFKGHFHTEISDLPDDFLKNIFKNNLPISGNEQIIYDSDEAIIYARNIDVAAVREHLDSFQVKNPSYQLTLLLGDDWAPPNSNVTTKMVANVSHYVECDSSLLNTYITDIAWACGITRYFDSDISIDKKARDITKQLSDAVNQVPYDKPSIIHIAAETLEGKEIEIKRTEKVMSTIPDFITDKPVVGVRFHRFQSNQTTDQLFLFDETVNKFQVDGIDLSDIPESAVVVSDVEMKEGSHWELYD